MIKCKQCGANVPQIKKKRAKLYCNSKCKQAYRSANSNEMKELPYSLAKLDRKLKEKGLFTDKWEETPKGRYSKYKSGAKRRQLEFKLTLNQFKKYWRQPCHYCGDSIRTIGLDRIDSSIGYNIDNIVPCCPKCNWMKMTQGYDEFIEHCKKIVENR